MSNPTLPPSIAAEIRRLEQRIRALEMGESNLSYRQALTTNDASTARVLYSSNGLTDCYSAALVNPKYEVLVARWHVILYGSAVMNVRLQADMGSTVRTTQTWTRTGKPSAFAFHTFEVAWLHGMPVNQWAESDEDTRLRRGNVQFLGQVTTDHVQYPRTNTDIRDSLVNQFGFTASQANGLADWFTVKSNLRECFYREPEYAFLAPLSSFPTATLAGTLLPGSVVDD